MGFLKYRFSLITISLTFFLFIFSGAADSATAQEKYKIKMTLQEVIETAREQSQQALVAKHNFLANYWQYRSFKAKLLPSLNLNASLGQYNRSLVALQNSETGEYNYIVNNNMTNSLSLSIDQNIALTGGKISLITSLNRLDQFSPNENVMFNSQPVKINYTQPIKAFNSLKWDKIVEPKQYERAKRDYKERLEEININAVNLFFNVLSSQISLEMARKNLESTELSLKIAEERYEIGTISKNDVLSLQRSLYNSQLEIRDRELDMELSHLNLRTFLGFNENVEISLVMPEDIPEVSMEYMDVYRKSVENSSFMLENELTALDAEQQVARAKASTGLQANFFAIFGLTQRGDILSDAYSNPMDQEIIGLSLSLPILDWGMGKGQVKLARSREEVVKAQIDQSIEQYKQDILIKVMQFNKLKDQCDVSMLADSIAKLSYDIANERFVNGSITVLELNSAQNDMTNSASRFISDLGSFWREYYTIRKLTLYDYLKEDEIDVDFDILVEN
jgi:outer membrane protein TolC